MDYTNPDRDILWTRNEFRTPEEIEIRRQAELMQLLEVWANGETVWRVLHDIGFIFDDWTSNPFYMSGRKIFTVDEHRVQLVKFCKAQGLRMPNSEELQKQAETRHQETSEEITQAQMRLNRHIKPDFFDVARQGEIHGAINEFYQHVQQNEISSYAIGRSIVDTTCLPVPAADKDLFGALQNPVRKLFELIDSEEKRAKKEETQLEEVLKGTLESETEDRVLERLVPALRKMKRKAKNPDEKLITAISIEASGTGMIKPYNCNPDYLPKTSKENNGVDNEGDDYYNRRYQWSPYDETDHKEYIYGTTTALITTYAVSFEPVDQEQLKFLRREVRKALIAVAETMPAFGIPTDPDSRPYNRPFAAFRDRYGRKPKWSSGKLAHVDVTTRDGKVHIVERLDLDDVLKLYYLLEHRMKLNASFAHVLQNAIQVEARSAPHGKSDLDDPYSVSSMKPDVQVGALVTYSYGSRNHVFIQAMEDSLALYAGNETHEGEFLKQIITIAAQSLTGRMTDEYGAFPIYQLLLGRQDSNKKILTFDDALRQRTLDLLNVVAGNDLESVTPPGAALMLKAARISQKVRDEWRESLAEMTRQVWGHHTNHREIKGFKEVMEEQEVIQNLSDVVAGLAKRHPDQSEAAKQNAVAIRSNIVLHDNPVPPCLDRTYEGTLYTSRMPFSPWERHALPSKLSNFVAPAQNPHRAATKLLVEFKEAGLG